MHMNMFMVELPSWHGCAVHAEPNDSNPKFSFQFIVVKYTSNSGKVTFSVKSLQVREHRLYWTLGAPFMRKTLLFKENPQIYDNGHIK